MPKQSRRVEGVFVEQEPERELETLLDDVSYQLTNARSAGFARPADVRAALRRARDLIADADALVAGVEAERTRDRD